MFSWENVVYFSSLKKKKTQTTKTQQQNQQQKNKSLQLYFRANLVEFLVCVHLHAFRCMDIETSCVLCFSTHAMNHGLDKMMPIVPSLDRHGIIDVLHIMASLKHNNKVQCVVHKYNSIKLSFAQNNLVSLIHTL